MLLASATQHENESLGDYISRLEGIKNQLEEFDTIKNNNYYVIKALHGLHMQYETLKTVININKLPNWEDFKEIVESHGSMLGLDIKTKQILEVSSKSSSASFPIIHKNRRNTNYKRFTNSQPNCRRCLGKNHTSDICESDKWCNTCNNASHNLSDCWYNKPQNINDGYGEHSSSGNAGNRRGFAIYRSRRQQGRVRRPYTLTPRGRSYSQD